MKALEKFLKRIGKKAGVDHEDLRKAMMEKDIERLNSTSIGIGDETLGGLKKKKKPEYLED